MTITMEEDKVIEILELAEDEAINDEVAELIEGAIDKLLVMFNSEAKMDRMMEAVASGRESGYKDGYKQGYIDGNTNGFNRGIEKGIREMEELYKHRR